MKQNIKKIFYVVCGCIAVILLAIITTTITHDNLCTKSGLNDYSYQIYRSRMELSMEGIKDNIVTEIDNYIDSVAIESGVNGIRLFELCDMYGVDVRFAMAQAEAESHFGTKGTAAKTNSVFNVGAFDGDSAEVQKRKGYGFSHPDDSIEPYLLLLVNTYLVNGKTEEDLFIKFVNKDGKRYASNPNYETMLLTIYNKINENTKLKTLLQEYRRYKMILN